MKVGCKLDKTALAALQKDIDLSVLETAEAVRVDVQQSQTMPMDSGNLQNRSTFARGNKDGTADIVSDTPYARRLYFHPEYNFSKEKNPNAGGKWFEPYISGAKKDFVQKAFERLLRSRIK